MALTQTSQDIVSNGVSPRPHSTPGEGIDDRARNLMDRVERLRGGIGIQGSVNGRQIFIPNPLLRGKIRSVSREHHHVEVGQSITQVKRQLEGEIQTLKLRNPLSHIFGFDKLAYRDHLIELEKLAKAYIERQKHERDDLVRIGALTSLRAENTYIKYLSDVEKLAEWIEKEKEKVQDKINKSRVTENKKRVQESLRLIRGQIGEYIMRNPRRNEEDFPKFENALVRAAEGDRGDLEKIINGLDISDDQKKFLKRLAKKISIHPYKNWKYFCATVAVIGATATAATALGVISGGAILGGVAMAGGVGGILAPKRKIEGEKVSNQDMRSIYRSIEQEKYNAFHPVDSGTDASKASYFEQIEKIGYGQTMVVETRPGEYERYTIVSINNDGTNNNIVLRNNTKKGSYVTLDYTEIGSVQFHSAGTRRSMSESGAVTIKSMRNDLSDPTRYRNAQIRVDGRQTSPSPFLPYISIVTDYDRAAAADEARRLREQQRVQEEQRRGYTATNTVNRCADYVGQFNQRIGEIYGRIQELRNRASGDTQSQLGVLLTSVEDLNNSCAPQIRYLTGVGTVFSGASGLTDQEIIAREAQNVEGILILALERAETILRDAERQANPPTPPRNGGDGGGTGTGRSFFGIPIPFFGRRRQPTPPSQTSFDDVDESPPGSVL